MPYKIWLDNARIISCFAVVFLHVASGIVYHDPATAGAWWAGNLYNAFSRWSVPFFLMITGVLLLDPEKNEPVKAFYRKRFGRILVPLVFWTLFYSCIRIGESLNNGGSMGTELTRLARDICAGKPYYHLWYLYTLTGLYLFLPIVRCCVKAAPLADTRLLCGVWFAIAISTSAVFSLSGPHTGDGFTLFLGSFFNFAPYCLAGYLIGAKCDKHEMPAPHTMWGRWIIIISVVATALCTLLFAYALRGVPYPGKFYFYGFLSITVVPMSLALFSLMPMLSKPLLGIRHNRGIAGLTLGIYCIHPAVLKLCSLAGFTPTAFNPFIAIPALACAVFLASAICTAAIRAVPVLKKATG